MSHVLVARAKNSSNVMAIYLNSMVHVVVGIVLNAEQQVLIAQRLPHQEKGGMWEFPGGKVELEESAFDALKRELKEEVGIEIIDAEPWTQVEYHYPHKSVLLDTWMITEFNGIPVGAEGQPVKWGSTLDLTQLEFPEGNRPIIKKLLDFWKQ
jgi:8-oxo-dGTP diphosphatase